MSENVSYNMQPVSLSQDSFDSFSSFKKPENRMIIKRDGRSQKINFRHIHDRIETLAKKFDCKNIDLRAIIEFVECNVKTGIHTSQLDRIAAYACTFLSLLHPDYNRLATVISVSNLHKQKKQCTFLELIEYLSNIQDSYGHDISVIDKDFLQFVKINSSQIEQAIDHSRDYQLFNHDAITFMEEKNILLQPYERPQHMLMRVALHLGQPNIKEALSIYSHLSRGDFIFPLSSMMLSGFKSPHLVSNYSISIGDSLQSIYLAVNNVGKILSKGGEVSINVSELRGEGSEIRKTNGTATGPIPMLKVFDQLLPCYDMGGRFKEAKVTVYYQIWNSDLVGWLELKKSTGSDSLRARNLDYALIIPDLFMKRVEKGEKWSMFCPTQAQELNNRYGQEQFEKWYTEYQEVKKVARKVIDARELWQKIVSSISMYGSPKIMFKEAICGKSNQIIGQSGIKCGGMQGDCPMIVSEERPSSSVSAEISLPRFVKDAETFDFEAMQTVTGDLVRALDRMIDTSMYVSEEAKLAAQENRVLSIGVQGMSDAMSLMNIGFEDDRFRILNCQIMQSIYFAALSKSCELAKEMGPCKCENKLMKDGIFNFEIYGITNSDTKDGEARKLFHSQEQWQNLRLSIKQFGIHNSLLTSIQADPVTSLLLGNTPGFNIRSSNISIKEGSKMQAVTVNRHLVRDLIAQNQWNAEVQQKVINNNGSIQNIKQISQELKNKYKTAWDVKQRLLMELALDRAPFITQSQNMIISMEKNNNKKVDNMLKWAWSNGMKTGVSCMRTNFQKIDMRLKQSVIGVIQGALTKDSKKMLKFMKNKKKQDQENESKARLIQSPQVVCKLRPPGSDPNEECLMCGS